VWRYHPDPAAGWAPSRARPANSPWDRDHDRISACICASVWAVAVRPTGPAATEPSAPRVNLLESSFSAPRAFITSMIRSVSEPPIWKPTLPPSMGRCRELTNQGRSCFGRKGIHFHFPPNTFPSQGGS
jgi:hypothetical protein